jgi:hypothetical protein
MVTWVVKIFIGFESGEIDTGTASLSAWSIVDQGFYFGPMNRIRRRCLRYSPENGFRPDVK